MAVDGIFVTNDFLFNMNIQYIACKYNGRKLWPGIAVNGIVYTNHSLFYLNIHYIDCK
jgi:hypothetical protein